MQLLPEATESRWALGLHVLTYLHYLTTKRDASEGTSNVSRAGRTRLVDGGLGLAAHALHVLLVLLLDVLHPDAVDAVEQRHLRGRQRRAGFAEPTSKQFSDHNPDHAMTDYNSTIWTVGVYEAGLGGGTIDVDAINQRHLL